MLSMYEMFVWAITIAHDQGLDVKDIAAAAGVDSVNLSKEPNDADEGSG